MSKQPPEQVPEFFPLAADNPVFVRQRDEYSCSVGALASVSNIYNRAAEYDALRQSLAPHPDIGVETERMLAEIEKRLPVTAAGENVYKGGVAIAVIMQEGEGHYIVLLRQEKDRIAYYDPYHHRIVVDSKNNIEWISGDKRHKNWSVDFAELPDNSIRKWTQMAKT